LVKVVRVWGSPLYCVFIHVDVKAGERPLAWFELTNRRVIDPGTIINWAAQLATARYRIDLDELSERTGMKLIEAEPTPPPGYNAPTDPGLGRFFNRAGLSNNCGTGDGGFQAGNECGKGGGSSDGLEELSDGNGGTKRVPELRETRVPVPAPAFAKIGIEPGNVFADYAHLKSKHPEQFTTSRDVKEHVEYVMSSPQHVLPGNMPDHRLIVRESSGQHPAVALEIEKKGGKYRVRSVHMLNQRQVNERLSNADGPGESSGGAYVNRRFHDETSLRLWAVLAEQLPSDVLNRYIDNNPARQLVNRASDELGVPTSWLKPVRDLLAEIAAKAEDKSLTEQELAAYVEQAARRVPELFGEMDVDAFAELLEGIMGAAAVEGVRDALKH
jgi:hypothetical protein